MSAILENPTLASPVEPQRLLTIAGLFVSAVLAALFIHYLTFKLINRLNQSAEVIPKGALRKHFRRPTLWIMLVITTRLVMPLWHGLPARESTAKMAVPQTVEHIFTLVLIALVSWLVIKATNLARDCVVSRFDIEQKDNLRARKLHTQLNVLRRIVIIVVSILALGTMLMTFPKVRQLGTTILASAGIIGIVVGMAAQRTIGTFIAGIQIAITQPIRVDDVVIVENEWGRIEEITLTYVVVRIWDLRRLIIPITYFIEKPFQNWTRTTADILGTVYIYVDYTVGVDTIRQQLQKILNETELWDKKVCVLQVTNTTEQTVELRALVSAADASAAWGLRCYVREKLIEFIREEYPQALPKLRAELHQIKTEQTT
jgi:small-conductance mechanosensitive channel